MTTRALDRGVAIGLVGELDLSTASEAEKALRHAEAGAPFVLVDLRGVSFLDSTGLRLILAADARAKREGRRLALVPGPESVHRVFRIALLEDRLEFVDPPDEGGPDGTG